MFLCNFLFQYTGLELRKQDGRSLQWFVEVSVSLTHVTGSIPDHTPCIVVAACRHDPMNMIQLSLFQSRGVFGIIFSYFG